MVRNGNEVRIVLASRPRMLRELIRNVIAQHADLNIVDECLRPGALPSRTRESRADVVILGSSDYHETKLCARLFAQSPQLTVLLVSADGEVGGVEQLRPRRWNFALADHDIPTVIRLAIRAAREPDGAWDCLDLLTRSLH
jgi:DNA-binding NarL/FixJ family response regulator